MGERLGKHWVPALAGLAASLFAFAAQSAPVPGDSRALADGISQGHRLTREPRVVPVRGLIAIVIDDLGQQHGAGLQAIALPGPVALAFMPHAANTARQAELAWASGKEVLVHLPLEPAGAARPYPTALSADAGPAELTRYFASALASVPHARGVNNHQGSLFTERAGPMSWLIAEIHKRPELYFLDSRTTAGSVGYRIARAQGVPTVERSVFLDNERSETAVRAAFDRLVEKALADERALAIGHPYPETFKVLNERLPQLAALGVRLVAPSELIARQNGVRTYRQLKLIETIRLRTPAALPLAAAAAQAAAR